MTNSHTGKKVRILVVDDHPLTRNLVKAILKGLGYNNIVLAENGQNAIRCLAADRFDIMICDWNMPNMTGIEVLKQVRSIEKYKKMPFLMLTAEAYRENISAAMESGVSDYITKPFTAETLGNKIERVLKAQGLDK